MASRLLNRFNHSLIFLTSRFPWGKSPLILLMTGGSGLFFFICSSIRHLLFKSNAYDLGWFDQFVYLISQGQPPIVSFAGYHLLGDHVSIIFYPIALLYKIYPSVYWLFGIQAISLSLGCWLVYRLAKQAAIHEKEATILGAVYLLYPLVFNINIYDFHPEVIAIPGFLGAVLAARSRRILSYIFLVLLILSCKAVLSLTVAGMGLWLLLFEKRRRYGAIALFLGTLWFFLTTQIIIPHFSGAEQASVARYGYLGNSVLEITLNLILKPNLVLGRVFSVDSLAYFSLLFLPVGWGLVPRYLTPMVAALPTLGLNLLSESFNQRNLVQQYSVPILPFLFLALIGAWGARKIWFKNYRLILLCSLIGFLSLAKYGFFWSVYLRSLDTWKANREAIALIQTKGSVIAPDQLLPHLSHRTMIQLPRVNFAETQLEEFEYILLDRHHPGFTSSIETVDRFTTYLGDRPNYQQLYRRDGVVLYHRTN